MHRRKLRWPAVGLVAVLLVGGGTAYAVASGDSVPRYRTVAAVTGSIEQTLASSGSVDAANRADVGFGTDGTIARMKVAVGDTVKAGQALAVLQTAKLDAAVTEAEASVAQAVAQLAADRATQSSSVEEAVSKPTGSSGSPSSSGDSAAAAATAATLKALKALQEKVIAAQSTASAALAAAKSALAAQTAACADAFETPSADPTEDAEGAVDAADDDSAACTSALAEVQAKQQDVSDAQDALAKALDDLGAALTKALGSTKGPTTPQASNARTSTTSETPAADGGASGGATITAARLAADQAQIEQAKADLVTAQQARDQATLRATRSGKVVALAAGKGDAVSAGDTVATIVGGKAITVTGSVAEEKLDQVEVGQKVKVTVPGSEKAADGIVTAIGMVADSSSGTTSYPVTVTVDDPSIALPTGSSALLEIVLSTVSDVITVPTSAVTRGEGTAATVRVWDGSKLTTKAVVLGATSTRTVQVASGLKIGDEVVLAAIDDPIDGASSELNQRGGFGGGGAPVAVFRGGPGGAGGGPQNFSSTK